MSIWLWAGVGDPMRGERQMIGTGWRAGWLGSSICILLATWLCTVHSPFDADVLGIGTYTMTAVSRRVSW